LLWQAFWAAWKSGEFGSRPFPPDFWVIPLCQAELRQFLLFVYPPA
jgi:hypothetical protein